MDEPWNAQFIAFGIGTLLLIIFSIRLAPLVRTTAEDRAAEQRARHLLSELLTAEECRQLAEDGFLTVRSRLFENRTYRIPVHPRQLVNVYEHGRWIMCLCVAPAEMVPTGDHILIHKLMIEGDEANYLHTAERWTTQVRLLTGRDRL